MFRIISEEPSKGFYSRRLAATAPVMCYCIVWLTSLVVAAPYFFAVSAEDVMLEPWNQPYIEAMVSSFKTSKPQPSLGYIISHAYYPELKFYWENVEWSENMKRKNNSNFVSFPFFPFLMFFQHLRSTIRSIINVPFSFTCVGVSDRRCASKRHGTDYPFPGAHIHCPYWQYSTFYLLQLQPSVIHKLDLLFGNASKLVQLQITNVDKLCCKEIG